MSALFEQILPPADDYLDVEASSKRLSVTTAEIRRLISAGELPAAKVAGRWLIPIGDIERRRSLAPPSGRRFAPSRAWGLLFLAASEAAPWLDPDARWRMKTQLERHRLAELRGRLTARGRARRAAVALARVDALRADPDLMLSGVSAPGLGLVGVDERIEAYIDASLVTDLAQRYGLSASREPNVVLRIVPSDIGWDWRPAPVAPRSAVALDLAEDSDAIIREFGLELLSELG